MEFYTQNVSSIADVMLLVTMILQSSTFRALLFSISMVWFMIVAFNFSVGNGAGGSLKSFIIFLIIAIFTISANAPLKIKDYTSPTEYVITDAPFTLTILAGVSSLLPNITNKLFSTVFNPLADKIVGNGGMSDGLALMYGLKEFGPMAMNSAAMIRQVKGVGVYNGQSYSNYIREYITQCVVSSYDRATFEENMANVFTLDLDSASPVKMIRPPQNIYVKPSLHGYPLEAVSYDPTTSVYTYEPYPVNPQFLTCNDHYAQVKKLLHAKGLNDHLTHTVIKEFQTSTQGSELSEDLAGVGLTTWNDLTKNRSASLDVMQNIAQRLFVTSSKEDALRKFVVAELLKNITKDLKNIDIHDANSGRVASAINDPRNQEMYSKIAQGLNFNRHAKSMSKFLEFLMLCWIPVGMLLMLMGKNGIAGFAGLFKQLIWIQSWPLAYTLIAYFVNKDLAGTLDNYALGGVTMEEYYFATEAIQKALSNANSWLGMTPLVTAALLWGGPMMMSQMAGKFSSQERVDEDRLHRNTHSPAPIVQDKSLVLTGGYVNGGEGVSEASAPLGQAVTINKNRTMEETTAIAQRDSIQASDAYVKSRDASVSVLKNQVDSYSALQSVGQSAGFTKNEMKNQGTQALFESGQQSTKTNQDIAQYIDSHASEFAKQWGVSESEVVRFAANGGKMGFSSGYAKEFKWSESEMNTDRESVTEQVLASTAEMFSKTDQGRSVLSEALQSSDQVSNTISSLDQTQLASALTDTKQHGQANQLRQAYSHQVATSKTLDRAKRQQESSSTSQSLSIPQMFTELFRAGDQNSIDALLDISEKSDLPPSEVTSTLAENPQWLQTAKDYSNKSGNQDETRLARAMAYFHVAAKRDIPLNENQWVALNQFENNEPDGIELGKREDFSKRNKLLVSDVLAAKAFKDDEIIASRLGIVHDLDELSDDVSPEVLSNDAESAREEATNATNYGINKAPHGLDEKQQLFKQRRSTARSDILKQEDNQEGMRMRAGQDFVNVISQSSSSQRIKNSISENPENSNLYNSMNDLAKLKQDRFRNGELRSEDEIDVASIQNYKTGENLHHPIYRDSTIVDPIQYAEAITRHRSPELTGASANEKYRANLSEYLHNDGLFNDDEMALMKGDENTEREFFEYYGLPYEMQDIDYRSHDAINHWETDQGKLRDANLNQNFQWLHNDGLKLATGKDAPLAFNDILDAQKTSGNFNAQSNKQYAYSNTGKLAGLNSISNLLSGIEANSLQSEYQRVNNVSSDQQQQDLISSNGLKQQILAGGATEIDSSNLDTLFERYSVPLVDYSNGYDFPEYESDHERGAKKAAGLDLPNATIPTPFNGITELDSEVAVSPPDIEASRFQDNITSARLDAETEATIIAEGSSNLKAPMTDSIKALRTGPQELQSNFNGYLSSLPASKNNPNDLSGNDLVRYLTRLTDIYSKADPIEGERLQSSLAIARNNDSPLELSNVHNIDSLVEQNPQFEPFLSILGELNLPADPSVLQDPNYTNQLSERLSGIALNSAADGHGSFKSFSNDATAITQLFDGVRNQAAGTDIEGNVNLESNLTELQSIVNLADESRLMDARYNAQDIDMLSSDSQMNFETVQLISEVDELLSSLELKELIEDRPMWGEYTDYSTANSGTTYNVDQVNSKLNERIDEYLGDNPGSELANLDVNSIEDILNVLRERTEFMGK